MDVMNLLRKLLALIRKESVMGGLKRYERARYTADDLTTNWGAFHVNEYAPGRYAIIVQPDAETFADVSFYQSGMDWGRYPHRAAIIRIGQNSWKDSEFERNYSQARSYGKALGGYFFYDDRATPQAQANLLIAAMQGKYFELEIFIDYEKVYGGAYQGTANVKKMIELVEAAGVACKAVGTYTGYYFWLDHASVNDYPFFASRPLWIAWYAAASVVKIPAPWNIYTHWQYNTVVDDWGQPTAEIDANKSAGTKTDFENKYLGGTTPPTEPPPTGGTVKTYFLTVTADPAKQFANPDGTSDVGPNLKKGDTFTSTSTNGVTYRNDSSGRYVKVGHVHLDKTVDETTSPPVEPTPTNVAHTEVIEYDENFQMVSITWDGKKLVEP